MYKLTAYDTILRIPDGASIPPDPANADYAKYLVWRETNTPEPYVPPVPVPQTCITKLAFRNRFTLSEKVTLEIAALDNPAAPMPQRQQAAALRAHTADTAAAEHVDLRRADTRAGVQMLEANSLIAPGRALEILDAPVQRHEVAT